MLVVEVYIQGLSFLHEFKFMCAFYASICACVLQHVWFLGLGFFLLLSWCLWVFLCPQMQTGEEISYTAKYVKTAKDLLLFINGCGVCMKPVR